jgi:hypothetical protein
VSDNKSEVRDVTRVGAPRIKTWRERIGVAADFPLYAPTEVERAMEAEIAELRASYAAKGPLNGIPATWRHGEGAIARCSYCGRYSLDPATLGPDSRQPVCECGKQHGWSGSFVKPGPDAKWSGHAPAPMVAVDEARDEYLRAGWFLYEGIEWVATSSDDPRATVLYRCAAQEGGAS